MDSNSKKNPYSIGLLLTEGFALMSYASLVEPIRAANLLAGKELYKITDIAVCLKVFKKEILQKIKLEKDGFDGNPYYYLLIAEIDNQIIGVCFYFIRYSTWKGKVLFLEDFVVKEEYRRKGIGGMLFEETIRISKKENLDGLHWQVLDWNTPALNFYNKYEATISSAWLNGRLNKEQIKNIKDLV